MIGLVMRADELVRDPAGRVARIRSRWLVHLALLLTLAVLLVLLLLFGVSPRVTIRVVIACAFASSSSPVWFSSVTW
jgi:hypothetical protein